MDEKPDHGDIVAQRAVAIARDDTALSLHRKLAAAARELHEGDALGTLVVKEIRPSAVVFLHGAETLERRVGGR